VQQVNEVYRALLERLRLSAEHRNELRKRGLSAEEIGRRGYRTLPGEGRRRLAAGLAEEFGQDALLQVPGLVLTGKGDGRHVTIAGKAGLLIPCRDESGMVLALKVCADDPGNGPKDLHLTSTGHGGPGPGSPVHWPLDMELSNQHDAIRITCGELAADVAACRSGVATVAIPAPGDWPRGLAVALRYAGTVRLAFGAAAQADAAVARAQVKCARQVAAVRGVQLELELWDPKYPGIGEVLAAGQEPQVLRGAEAMAAAEAMAREAGRAKERDGRVKIVVTTDEHVVNAKVVRALVGARNLYQRGNLLVRVVRDRAAPKGIKRPALPRIEPLPKPMLREYMSRCARFVEQTENGQCPAHPPNWTIAAVHARGDWPGLPRLEAVVDYPVLRADGSLALTPGYDTETGLLLTFPADRFVVPDTPSRAQALAARDELLEVVEDFPFAAEAHKAAWLAALLTPLARFAYSGPSPLFLANANVAGAGKGLLLDCIAKIVTGQRYAVTTYTNKEEELRKRITSLVLAGERLVLFDNLTGRFGNGTLDAALTAETWSDRLLGGNRIVRGPMNMVFYGTGNNVAVLGDTVRRVCHILLQSLLEKPELRQGFRHPHLLSWVARNRPRLLAAALTILRGYFVAGCPEMNLKAWGSFEGWSAVVRSAVVWAEMPDPGETRFVLEDGDSETRMMSALLTLWPQMEAALGKTGTGLIAAEVMAIYAQPPESAPAWHMELKDVLEGLLGQPDSQKLGYKLRSYRSRVLDGRCLQDLGESHKVKRWTVRSMAG
jgi:hypothetical protein